METVGVITTILGLQIFCLLFIVFVFLKLRNLSDAANKKIESLEQHKNLVEERLRGEYGIYKRLLEDEQNLNRISDACHLVTGKYSVPSAPVKDVMWQLLKALDLKIDIFSPDAAQASEVKNGIRLVKKTDKGKGSAKSCKDLP